MSSTFEFCAVLFNCMAMREGELFFFSLCNIGSSVSFLKTKIFKVNSTKSKEASLL